ncbi:MAG: tripartite tricarboxylate transporter substrate binding protein, partial [Alphaproteobacteria bacterium]
MADLRLTRRSALALLAAPALARAQGADVWPSRSIRLVVPFGPGGPTDVMARVIASGLSSALGRPVGVENRPGASGNVGIAHA